MTRTIATSKDIYSKQEVTTDHTPFKFSSRKMPTVRQGRNIYMYIYNREDAEDTTLKDHNTQKHNRNLQDSTRNTLKHKFPYHFVVFF